MSHHFQRHLTGGAGPDDGGSPVLSPTRLSAVSFSMDLPRTGDTSRGGRRLTWIAPGVSAAPSVRFRRQQIVSVCRWLSLCLVLVFAEWRGPAAQWQPSEQFLKAVRYVESSNGLFVFGDGGESLGDFQMSEAAWVDVSAWRKARRLVAYSYDRNVFNRSINRLYAANYLSILHEELSRKLNRPPGSGELYAAYNLGLTQFAQCNYSLKQVNPVTQRKCRLIAEILGGKLPEDFASNTPGARS